ncbi:hypothetical protein HID58_002935, partial [Brassica napus]
MIGDNEGDGDSGSTEIAIAKGDGGLLEITDLDVSQSKEGGRGESPVRRSEADATTGCETDIVELEGFSSKDNVERSSSEIVTKLLTELESISGRENLSSKTPPVEAVDLRNSEQQVEEIKEKEWALVTLKSGGMASPGKVVKAVQGCTSLNGFQILQDLREEGEINEDDVDDEDDDESVDEVGAVVVVEEDGARGIGGQDAGNTTVTAAQTEVEEAIGSKIPPKNSSSIRGRGRGSKQHSRATASRMDMNAIREFQDVVEKCDMMDLAQVGPSFTWSNCQNDNPISKKLDRVMINSVWINEFPHSFVTFESGGVSDHMRMHTQLRNVPPVNMKPFKFFNHLTGHPKFLEVVEWVWNESPPLFHSRSALGMFQEKLKALKFDMRGLNRDLYGDLPGRVKLAYEELCARQTEAMQNPQTL